MSHKLIYGVGINDANYKASSIINGKRVTCPYISTWRGILRRCYNAGYQSKNPTYVGCSVSEEWKTFSNFKRWMETQDWQGKQLDKDILFKNNRQYNSTSCAFVDRRTNLFLTDHGNSRGKFMLGVHWSKAAGKFRAQCRTGEGNQVFLGYFDCELSAHLAWKKYKYDLACKLADEQTDVRVAVALRQRYL